MPASKIRLLKSSYLVYVFGSTKSNFLNSSTETSHFPVDAVVVWGGKEAVSALRRMIPPNTKMIEWGHKISFAYVTEQAVTAAGLEGLAKNIVETGQLLCSSLQGIFLDTNDMGKAAAPHRASVHTPAL